MLTSLCVFFFESHRELWWPCFCFFVFFLNYRQFEGLELSFQSLGGEAVRWGVAEVVGGLLKWHQSVGRAVGAAACGVCVCPLSLSASTSWVCIVNFAVCSAGLAKPPPTHTALRTGQNKHHSSRHERSWVFKALALSGNSWLGRHGGSWLLLLLLLFLAVLWF